MINTSTRPERRRVQKALQKVQDYAETKFVDRAKPMPWWMVYYAYPRKKTYRGYGKRETGRWAGKALS